MLPGAPTTPFDPQAKGWLRLFIGVLSLAGLIGSRQTASAGCDCLMESMSVFANYNKTGFPECQPSTPPKLFLVRKIVTSDSGGSVASPSGNSTTWKDYEIQTDTYDPKTILPGGDPSYACRTWTLGFSSTDYSGNSGNVNDVGGAVSWQEDFTSIYTSGTNGATQTNSCNGWWQDSATGETGNLCVDPGPVYDIMAGYFDDVTVVEGAPVCTSMVTEASRTDSAHATSTDPFDGTVGTYDQHDSFDTITTLSGEFIDSMLTDQINVWLTNWPATWGGGTGLAYFNFNDQNHFCASGGKFKYRVKVPDSDLGTTYVLHWQEITLAADGTQISAIDRQRQVQGTGDPENPAVSVTIDVDMPTTPSTIYETAPEIIQTFSSGGGGGGGGGGNSSPGDMN